METSSCFAQAEGKNYAFDKKLYKKCIKTYKNIEQLKSDYNYFDAGSRATYQGYNFKNNPKTEKWDDLMDIVYPFAFKKEIEIERKKNTDAVNKKIKKLKLKFKKKPTADTAYKIGDEYYYNFIPKRPEKALFWYKKYYELGKISCATYVANMYVQLKNYDKAEKWIKKRYKKK